MLRQKIAGKIKREEKLIFHDFVYLERHYQVIFIVIILFSVVLIWRGLWNLVEYFWFPSYPLLSNILGLIMGIVVLYLSHHLMRQFIY